jgi:regulator of RNase E activity RraA
VVADRSGVVVIAAASIEEVLDTAEAIARREGGMAKALQGGTPISQVMNGHYEQMLENKR